MNKGESTAPFRGRITILPTSPSGDIGRKKSKSIKGFSVITPTRVGAQLGKTRGAIRFALIFLCLLSLYQDKESKSSSISFEIKLDSNAHNLLVGRSEAKKQQFFQRPLWEKLEGKKHSSFRKSPLSTTP